MNVAVMLLASMSVYLFLSPDPLSRLESIAGADRQPESNGRLRALTVRVLGRQHQVNASRKAAIDALVALSAELRAGTPQHRALQVTGEHVWPTACGAVRFDGDVAEALRLDAQRATLLTPLAALWSVAAYQGGGLAVAVTRLADHARAAEDVRVQLAAQMAGPRATARILMLLPIFGIAMGMVMGVNPLAWLLGSSLGIACLLLGILLTALGYWWTSRIVGQVERLL